MTFLNKSVKYLKIGHEDHQLTVYVAFQFIGIFSFLTESKYFS